MQLMVQSPEPMKRKKNDISVSDTFNSTSTMRIVLVPSSFFVWNENYLIKWLNVWLNFSIEICMTDLQLHGFNRYIVYICSRTVISFVIVRLQACSITHFCQTHTHKHCFLAICCFKSKKDIKSMSMMIYKSYVLCRLNDCRPKI